MRCVPIIAMAKTLSTGCTTAACVATGEPTGSAGDVALHCVDDGLSVETAA